MPEKNSLGDRLKKERAQAATAANYASGLQNFRDGGMNIFDVAGPGSSSPGGYTYNVPNDPALSKPVTPLSPAAPAPPRSREKVSAVNSGLTPIGIDGKVDFKTKGAISTAAGGNTDYSLNYKPTKIGYKGADATSPEADRFGLRGTGQTTGLENLAKSVNTKTAAEPTRKEMRQARRVERLERRQEIQKQKGQLAMQEGRFGDAKQKNWRAQNLQKRIDRNKARM